MAEANDKIILLFIYELQFVKKLFLNQLNANCL